MELSAIKGIGPTRLESLRAVGVCSLRDLLYFLPQRYEDRTHPIPCADANGGEVLVMGVVQDAPKLSRFNGLTRVTAYLWDDSGKLPLVWYNQPWMMQNLPVGQTIMLFGRMGQSRGKPVLQNAQRVTEPCILPVYRAVKGIPAKSFREMMQQALEQVDDCCPETLPNDLRIRHQLCELNFAIRQAHFPLNVENLRLARRRLAFEQMLMYQAALGLLRMTERSRMGADAAIAVVSASSLAVGVIVTSLTTGMTTDVDSYMFGSILAMTQADVVLSALLCVGVLVLFVLFYHRLFAITFDENFSRATGGKVGLYNTLLSVLTALTIVLGMRMMGAMLISSLVIFPALSAMRVEKSFRGVVVLAGVLSVLGFCAGLTGSYLLSTPVGASVVVVDLLIFLLCCGVRRVRG